MSQILAVKEIKKRVTLLKCEQVKKLNCCSIMLICVPWHMI